MICTWLNSLGHQQNGFREKQILLEAISKTAAQVSKKKKKKANLSRVQPWKTHSYLYWAFSFVFRLLSDLANEFYLVTAFKDTNMCLN